ncbi:MAG: Smr/MutS family endonuclease [Burkholderiales bacterium]|jgi:DNA-nicking Smr family endonuclease|nr:Smr/MutS family endonuclease [Burkholderiales bacterium]
MMKPLPPAPDDDADALDLLREALRDVTPIKAPDRVRHPPRRVDPVPVQRLRAQKEILAESLTDGSPLEDGFESGAELGFVREGLSRQALRKLRRGHWVVQGELDLHGLTVPAAREALVLFLQRCLRAGWRCVRIIHGRGLRSKNGEPVLRSKTAVWLSQRQEILAFCQARSADGGAGAVLVLLKGRKG